MEIQINHKQKIAINDLEDLAHLNDMMKAYNLKINKSQLARELNVDRRTVEKYLNGFKRTHIRKRKSIMDDYYDTIHCLLSNKSPHIFHYKRDLWKYLRENYHLTCSEVMFRAYISKKPEFQQYFD